MLFRLFLFTSLVCGLLSCGNILRDMPDKSADSYYIDLAQQALDREDFDEAVARITPVISGNPSDEVALRLGIRAYAGRAGLRILDFSLAMADSGGDTFFTIFAKQFQGADDDDVADMQSAIDLIEGFETDATLRSADLNLLAMFVYYGNIGVILNNRAFDTNNELVVTFDACSGTDLPSEDAQSIMQSLPKAIDSTSGVDERAGAAVESLNNSPAMAAFLNAENAECPGADLAAQTRCAALRSLVNGDAGIGLNTGGGACAP